MRNFFITFLVLMLLTTTTVPASTTPIKNSAELLPERIEQWQPNVCRVKAFSKSTYQTMGSGVYLGCGVILTCNHLFSDRVTHFEVTFHGDSQVHQAERNGTDPVKDIGFLLISPAPDTKNRKGVILNDTPLKVGDIVWQAGYGSDNRLFWHQSKIIKSSSHWLLTNRRARLGDSGGPVFTDSGSLAGNLWGRGETERTTWFNRSASIVDGLGHEFLNLLDVNHAQCNKDGCFIDGIFYRKGSRNNSNQPDGGGIYSPNNKRRIKNILEPPTRGQLDILIDQKEPVDPMLPLVPPPNPPVSYKVPDPKTETALKKLDAELELLKKEKELSDLQNSIKEKELAKERDLQIEKEAAIAKEVAKVKAEEQRLAEEKKIASEKLQTIQKEEEHEDHELTVGHTIDDIINDRGILHVINMAVISYFGIGAAAPTMFVIGIILTLLFKSGYLKNRRLFYGQETKENPRPKDPKPELYTGGNRSDGGVPVQPVPDHFSSVRNQGLVEKVQGIHTEINELKTTYKESMNLKQAELDQLNKDTKELDSIQNLKVDKTGS